MNMNVQDMPKTPTETSDLSPSMTKSNLVPGKGDVGGAPFDVGISHDNDCAVRPDESPPTHPNPLTCEDTAASSHALGRQFHGEHTVATLSSSSSVSFHRAPRAPRVEPQDLPGHLEDLRIDAAAKKKEEEAAAVMPTLVSAASKDPVFGNHPTFAAAVAELSERTAPPVAEVVVAPAPAVANEPAGVAAPTAAEPAPSAPPADSRA